ncbi:hypothetical protein GCM10007275_21240 [Jeotgalicoccus coquinae]|uniref:Membrane-associated PAP2 superfamily phosphatase n=1 Tax=Jeotgalicoccus coquinae TaxID=709509 RepID=A0A6V7RRD2_9STAP|nr:hypothetical protein [Jeotgalicoccus coquinae]MBB6424172.1 membrane-associated PAP2 superfamily phosphatase [Jeotgalicoccus coquinae]GGE25943.1 hypothetical protein GCM10007275_21240 [Jeotgalicoccus coquinae]CAD2081460.1 hypothetical protein JEOCOQ751_01963 [Jeotgalicoccus coquinae]
MFKVSKGLNIILIIIALGAIYYFSRDFLSASWNIPLVILLLVLGAASIISIIKREEPED